MATKNHTLIWVVVCLFFCCTFQETILVESIVEDTAENHLTSLKGEVIATSEQEVKIDHKAEEGQLEGAMLINEGKGEYYYAEIMAVNGTVHIHAIDEDLHESEIIIKKQNPVKYIDCLKNLILLKQIIRQQSTTQSSTSATPQTIIHEDISAYYILSLQTQNHTSSTQFLTYTSQHINPRIDDSSYTLAQGYVLTQILQYDEVNQFVYVLMRGYSHQQIITYKIDLGKKSETLITVSWLKSDGDNVLGGNGKTLIDGDKLEVLDYPQNQTVNLYEETKFVRTQLGSVVNISQTPIYTSNLLTIPLAGSFFMLLSQQASYQNVTAILFEGYSHSQKQSISVSHLHNLTDSTNNKITVFTDEYESVLIITRENALFVKVEWNQTEKKFVKSVVRLQEQIKDEALWKEVLGELNMAELAVYNDEKLYVLTSQHEFIVYSTETYTKLHEEVIVKSPPILLQPEAPLVAQPPITTSEQQNPAPTQQPPAPTTPLTLPPHSTWQDMVTLFTQIKGYNQKPTI